jgi:hypothetical protein
MELSVLIKTVSAGDTCVYPAKLLRRKARHIDQFFIIRQQGGCFNRKWALFFFKTGTLTKSLTRFSHEDKKGKRAFR